MFQHLPHFRTIDVKTKFNLKNCALKRSFGKFLKFIVLEQWKSKFCNEKAGSKGLLEDLGGKA